MAVALCESNRTLLQLKKAYGELQKGNLKLANRKLGKVKKRGTFLVEEVVYLLQRYEVVQQHYKERDHMLMQLVNELNVKEKQLRDEKELSERVLSEQEKEVMFLRQKLDQAQHDLTKAESRRKGAAETKKKATRGAIGGGILTVLVPPVGLAVLGISGGIAIASNVIESNAKANIDTCNGVIQDAEVTIDTTKIYVCQLECKINSISSDIRQKESEQQHYHNENTNVREVIVFLQAARAFWKEFSAAAEVGVKRTELLQKLITKAEQRKQYTIFNARGTKRVAQSFFDAWNNFEEMVENGDNYLFQMNFTCTQCGKCHTELPHLDCSKLVCESCRAAQHKKSWRQRCTIL